MTKDDVLFGYRQALFAEAARTSVVGACRRFGVHRLTYYSWKRHVDRHGLEVLRPRERRAPRMPNQLSKHIEERIVAFSLGHPGLGPKRIAAELSRPKWGGILVSPNGVWKVLCSRPGELVGIDCFFVGRLQGTKGSIWQLTAIDIASSFAWAELVICKEGTPALPNARQTSNLARRVAGDLREAGWRLERLLSDNGNEFKGQFNNTVRLLKTKHTRIRAGRPQTNGNVEALTARSSTSAGDPPSPATCTRRSQASDTTSRNTCASTTSTASTTAVSLPARSQPTSSTVPARWSADEPPHLSAYLGVRAP